MVDSARFKAALRCWASGVTVLTSRHADRIYGMTVSAFSSVSATPPLVLVCANQSSSMHPCIRDGGVFVVNMLASDQEDLGARFAGGDPRVRFDGVEWTPGTTGAPLLAGALASLECRLRSAHDEGTHTIYVGEVVATVLREGAEPLLYHRGAYRRILT